MVKGGKLCHSQMSPGVCGGDGDSRGGGEGPGGGGDTGVGVGWGIQECVCV